MESVTVSSKYQVIIPERVRREAGIKPGDRMAVIVKHNIIHYVPIKPLGATKGMVPGLDTSDLRDEYDRS
ncbi:MAG: AbrB/MazE/SpoVT family DNA-binding domain-containing protein [Candidatus Bathyarchaeia archaeon]|jgi:AbrB family looped-hinge helix DNA binding protein